MGTVNSFHLVLRHLVLSTPFFPWCSKTGRVFRSGFQQCLSCKSIPTRMSVMCWERKRGAGVCRGLPFPSFSRMATMKIRYSSNSCARHCQFLLWWKSAQKVRDREILCLHLLLVKRPLISPLILSLICTQKNASLLQMFNLHIL